MLTVLHVSIRQSVRATRAHAVLPRRFATRSLRETGIGVVAGRSCAHAIVDRLAKGVTSAATVGASAATAGDRACPIEERYVQARRILNKEALASSCAIVDKNGNVLDNPALMG
jgi:hypothetical protein